VRLAEFVWENGLTISTESPPLIDVSTVLSFSKLMSKTLFSNEAAKMANYSILQITARKTRRVLRGFLMPGNCVVLVLTTFC
jgi:hypothetical protein